MGFTNFFTEVIPGQREGRLLWVFTIGVLIAVMFCANITEYFGYEI